MEISELFWNASIDELKQGYIYDKETYICLLCGEKIERGIVYQHQNALYEAERYMRIHIENTHQSVFDYLINLNKKLTGITDHQNNLLRLFYQGKSDTEVQRDMGIGSASTIRHHRFALKEKERQAKTFLVMMELLKERDMQAPSIVQPHKTAKMVDDRYNITEKEQADIIKKFLPEGIAGRLKTFPSKEKQKLVILREIVKKFQGERSYNEKELNLILKDVYDDFVTLRRYLIEYGFFDRKDDGSEYWMKK